MQMKQVDIAEQLGNMIDKQSGYNSNSLSIDENIPAELEEPAPVFEVEYSKEELEAQKEALETVEIIVKSVVPESYQSNPMLINKMKLDAKQLGMLYYQQRTTNIVMIRNMDIIAAGSMDPKLFATFEKLQKRLADLSSQITDTQNQFRKYYIDTYLDLESKTRADEVSMPAPKRIAAGNDKPKLEDNSVQNGIETDNGGVKFGDNKSAIKSLADLKKERMKAKLKSVDVEIIETEEI